MTPSHSVRLRLVPFREVRHDQPEDCLHYEPVGVRGQLHDWKIPAHRHEDLFQLIWLASGRVQASLDAETHALEAPVVFILAAGTVHGFTFDRQSTGHQLTIPTPTLRDTLQAAPDLQQQLKHSFILDAAALNAGAYAWHDGFMTLAREFGGASPGRVPALVAQATLLVLQGLRLVAAQAPQARRVARRDTLVQRFRALLEMHFRQHRPLEFYASALGVSVDHLSRVCRATTGQSALRLVQGRLMAEARRLLTYTSASAAEVAIALGYDDPAYFSKCFTRVVGQPPSVFRAEARQGLHSA